jgi:hypothetical protein
MRTVLKLLGILLIWSLATTSSAEINLKIYLASQKTEQGRAMVRSYVTGVGRGVLWYNAEISAKNNSKLFCFPPKLALDQEVIDSLLNQEIRSPASGKSYSEKTPIELILIKAFETRFPCSGP